MRSLRVARRKQSQNSLRDGMGLGLPQLWDLDGTIVRIQDTLYIETVGTRGEPSMAILDVQSP